MVHRYTLFVAGILLACLLVLPQPADAVLPIPGVGKEKKEEVSIPDNATPQQVKDIMAGLDDTQVRRMLITELEKGAQPVVAQDGPDGVAGKILKAKAFVHQIRERVGYLFSGAASAPSLLPTAFRKSLSGDGVHPPGQLGLGLLAITVMWFVSCLIVGRRLDGLRVRIEDVAENATIPTKLGRLVVRALLDVFAVSCIALLTLIPYLLIFNEPEKGRPVIFAWFAAIVIVEVVRLVARFILAPQVAAVRFLPLKDETAQLLNKWVIRIAWVVASGLLASSLVRMTRGSELVYLLILSMTGFVVAMMLSLLALWHKKRVAESIKKHAAEGSLLYMMADSWLAVAILYSFGFWACWVVGLLLFGDKMLLSGVLTLLIVPGYLLVDWSTQRLVRFAVDMADTPAGESDEESDEGEEKQPAITRFQTFLSKSFRILVMAGAFFLLLSAWGIDLDLGRATVSAGIDTLLTLVIAYIFWVFVSGAIERKLLEKQGHRGHADSGEGGGGPAGDRFSTLLQLVKKFIFAAIAVVTVLIILSSLGVDIGPLIAGASVFGIAIGFGAQTLVKDIISGIFFLMDDAFRVGDYIIVGKAKGTVEEISVRSFKLRHHRGPLYTIPFGSIKEIQNMSRDWAIMKLQYLVPFDTDVQQVKKIMKKINKEIRSIPELNESMLDDIKSQGVMAMEEFGMRMRVKFMTKPGGQFTLRKLVLAKMRKHFEEAGIEFAKPRVSVSMPGETELTPEEELKVAAAASKAIEKKDAEEKK